TMSMGDFGNLLGSSIMESLGTSLGEMAGENLGESLGGSLGKVMGESMGAALGSALGSVIPVIGTIIGKLLGDALFGEKDPILQVAGISGFSRDPAEARRRGDFIETEFGEIFFRFRKMDRELQNKVTGALKQFDSTMAGIIRDEGQMEAATEALENMRYVGEGGNISMQDALQQRFTTILGTFDEFVENFVLEAATLEDQVQRLADTINIRARMSLGDTMAGDGDMVIWLAGELARAGETVGQSFERLLTVTSALDTAVALTGNTISASRAEVIRFSDALISAFGDDLQRLTAGLDRIFQTFFSEEEVLVQQAETARERAMGLLTDMGLDVTEQMLTTEGFRDIFDNLFGTLTPEMTAILIEAGVAVSDLIEAEAELADIRGAASDAAEDAVTSNEEAARAARQMARQLRESMADVDREIMRFANASLAAYHDLRDEQAAQLAALHDLGAAEEQVARARQLHHLQLQQFTADLKISILTLADELFGTADAIDTVATNVSDATSRIRDEYIRALEGIDAWLDKSQLSNLSPLTPTERLGEARSQFFDAMDRAGFDPDALAALPQLANALLAEGAGYHGTSTPAYRELFNVVQQAMQSAAEFDPPKAMDGPPTWAQVDEIRSSSNGFRDTLDELNKASALSELGNKLNTLAQISGQTPSIVARALGFTDEHLTQVLEGLGVDVGSATGDELSTAFNEVVGAINEQDPLLGGIGNMSSHIADMIEWSTTHLQRTMFWQGSFLQQIIRALGAEAEEFDPWGMGENDTPPTRPQMPGYETGGWVPRTEPALIHAGEYVVPRGGALVSRDPQQTAILERMDARLRNLERINAGGFAGVQDEERRIRQTMSARRETARV
ncbi:MAG: hypothetical protein ACOCVP_07730, partial [Wenzhouxiangella sp.]